MVLLVDMWHRSVPYLVGSGQHWGIAALYAQKRMGEITREMPKAKSIPIGGASPGGARPSATPGKIENLKTQGIDRTTYSDAERIASHPEILDRVIYAYKKASPGSPHPREARSPPKGNVLTPVIIRTGKRVG